MIKLVVSDMDGTFIHRLGISQKNLEAIQLLEKNHIDFAIASGRDYHGVYSVMDRYHIRCEAILGNGAQYVDKDGNILMSCYMNHNVIKDVIDVFDSLHISYFIYTTQGLFTGQNPQHVRDQFIERAHRLFSTPKEDFEKGGSKYNPDFYYLQHIDDIDQFVNSDYNIIKVEAFSLDKNDIPPAKDILKNIPTISYLSSFPDNVEVTDENAQKGYILEKVIQQKGIKKEEVIVLGDGMNDITLFQCFPYSYATGNAEEEIKKRAYKVVSSCADDGFAEAIEDMLKDLGD